MDKGGSVPGRTRLPAALAPVVVVAGMYAMARGAPYAFALGLRPALLISVSDDAFASPAGTKRLLSYYPRLFPLQQLVFTPADAGTRRLGHFGFFRRHAGSALWPQLLAQLEPNTSTV